MTNQISPAPYAILPPISSLQLSQFVSCSLKCSIPLGLSPSSPAPLFCFPIFFVTPSVSFYLSAAQSPTVTDPLQQAYAGVQHYAGDLSLLSSLLSHFLHLSLSLSPLPSYLSHQ